MRFAAVQFDIVWEDKPANHAIIERMLREADPAIEPGTFILLPELGDTGFSMNLDRIGDAERSLEWGQSLARKFESFVQIGFARSEAARVDVQAGNPESSKPNGRNCAAIIDPNGNILGEYQKIHPFSYGKESQFYSGGDHLLICRCGDANVCAMICYDLRFPELWRLAAIDGTENVPGAEVFTIGASWPSARQHHWRTLAIARAIENQAYIVAVNRVGNDPHLHYAGGSLIVAPSGAVIAEADDRPTVLQAEVDLASLRTWRAEFPALRDVKRVLLGSIQHNVPI
jgi:omega-amidase